MKTDSNNSNKTYSMGGFLQGLGTGIINTVGTVIGSQASSHYQRKNTRAAMDYENQINLRNLQNQYEYEMDSRRRAGISTAFGLDGAAPSTVSASQAPAPDMSQLGSVGSQIMQAYNNSRLIDAQLETEKTKQESNRSDSTLKNAQANYISGAQTANTEAQTQLFTVEKISALIDNKQKRFNLSKDKALVDTFGGMSGYAKFAHDDLCNKFDQVVEQTNLTKAQIKVAKNTARKVYQEFLNSKEYIALQKASLAVAQMEARTNARRVELYGEEISNNYVLGKNAQYIQGKLMERDLAQWRVDKKLKELTMSNLEKQGINLDLQNKYYLPKVIQGIAKDVVIGLGAAAGMYFGFKGMKGPKPPLGGSLITPKTSGSFSLGNVPPGVTIM